MPMDEEGKEALTMVKQKGIYSLRLAPQGLLNVTPYFQSMADIEVLAGLVKGHLKSVGGRPRNQRVYSTRAAAGFRHWDAVPAEEAAVRGCSQVPFLQQDRCMVR